MRVAFDLETTGIDPFYDVPVSLAFVSDKMNVVPYSYYINPGRPIPEGATAIHGITDSMVSESPDLYTGVKDIIDTLNTLWKQDHTIVGMNVSYDLTMVAALAKVCDLPELRVGKILDVLVIDRHFDKWRKGSRKLSSLCEYYKVELKDAHSAIADAKACLDILDKMAFHYPQIKNIDNKSLELWYRTWLVDYSNHRVETGDDAIPIGRFKWPIHSTLERIESA